MALSPFFVSPFTDLGGAIISQQWFGTCKDMELKVMDCLEAYGLERGMKKCDTLIQDFQECTGKMKQRKRIEAMMDERQRQYKAGERSKENLYAEAPPTDSY